MKKSLIYSTIIMLSSAMVFPAAHETPQEATDASVTELRDKLDAENAHCTFLPTRKHAKKDAYFFYDEARPYLAISVIRNMQMHKKKKGIEVFHEMRTFPGGVLFGLFEGADDRILQKVANEFLDSFDQNTIHADCYEDYRGFPKKIEDKIHTFGRAEIDQDKKDLESDDPAISLQAFKNQWRRDKVKMHLVVALAYNRKYKADAKPAPERNVFVWIPYLRAVGGTINDVGLIFPVERIDSIYDDSPRRCFSHGIKELQWHQAKNIKKMQSLKNVSCNMAQVLMKDDQDMLLPEYRTHVYAVFDELKFKKSICWDEVPVVVKKEKA